jgi:hypothetical protein
MICWAMQYYDHNKERLIDGGMKKVAERLTKTTIKRIFQDYREELLKGQLYPDLKPKTKKNCGVKSQLSDEVKENIIDLHFLT